MEINVLSISYTLYKVHKWINMRFDFVNVMNVNFVFVKY